MSVELIAEVSSNHGGDLELAKAFIWRYAEAGADWVKFQSYQVRTLRPNDPQREWLAQAELSDDAHHILKAECERARVKFLTTVFHRTRVPFLQSLGLEAIKIGSGEERDHGLVYAVCRSGVRVLQSKHMVGDRASYRRHLEDCSPEILSCVSRYPSSERSCVEAIGMIGYNRVVGYSDHYPGSDMVRWAIESGACIIEKHVSLPEQKRDKRSWEATVSEFKDLRQFADDDPQKYVGRWQHGD